MWRNDPDRPDDPRQRELETQRLARDEYDRPRYSSPPGEQPQAPDYHGRHEPSIATAGGAVSQAHAAAQPADLEHLPVHEIMTRRVASVHPATPAERVARLMEECDCGALPVVSDHGVLVGMLTDRDLALRVVGRGRSPRDAIAADCMTERVFACYPNESVAEVMHQMARHQVRRMPIVDERGRLLGIVAQSDLARHAGRHAYPEERHRLTDTLCAVSQPVHARRR